MNVVPLVLALAAAALDPAPPADPAPQDGPREWGKAPPGAPEDVALWNALNEAHAASVLHLARIVQASYRLRYGEYYQALDEKAERGTAGEAEGARRARARIETAANAADEAVPKKGLRVRVCKYTLFHLDQRMAVPDPRFAAELPEVRAEARGCVDELAPFAAKLGPLADAFERSLADADAFLKRVPPAVPPAPPRERDAASATR
ncbi:MAG TPA: hypothetical protein VFL83_10625 [Anaeromyxobacter sp.]|nr:hypothetical protein [Anaeromyxobacter sp.]